MVRRARGTLRITMSALESVRLRRSERLATDAPGQLEPLLEADRKARTCG
jgi:hypothetical protein